MASRKDCISSEEVIAIGDNVNDKLMIENAGLGVAMETARHTFRKWRIKL